MHYATQESALLHEAGPELRDALRQYKADLGVPEAEHIDQALREWLAERGVVKFGRKEAGGRKRA